MFRREKRALLRHYLEQGVPKAEIARRVGVSRRTVYHWIETGQLDRELDAEPVRYGPRRRAPSKLDPYKAVIDDRLATYPKLSATRLYREVRESGHQGQVDFADFVLPWGKRYALVVVLGYSRMLWLQYYERQMETVVRGVWRGVRVPRRRARRAALRPDAGGRRGRRSQRGRSAAGEPGVPAVQRAS